MSTTAIAVARLKLRGQVLRLPNLHRLCSERPFEISPHYEQLKQVVEERLDEWITDADARSKARETDLAYFSATLVHPLDAYYCVY
jgi:AcrR family transcriptional regulator